MFRGSQETLRLPSPELLCSETSTTSDDRTNANSKNSAVTFCCSVASQHHEWCQQPDVPTKLYFGCREASYGVLKNTEPVATTINEENGNSRHNEHNDDNNDNDDDDNDNDDAMDGFFMIAAESYPYALAGRTGAQVWPGSRILVDALLFPRPATDHKRLQHWQAALLRDNNNLRIVELGAGVGMVGTFLAAAGAQVLLTDLPSVVTESVVPTLEGNARNNKTLTTTTEHSNWLSLQQQPVFGIGRGFAAAAPLDWTRPVAEQLPHWNHQVDLIVASDCAFFPSMVEGLFTTVAAIFDLASNNNNNSSQPKLLLSCQRRDAHFFTSLEYVVAQIRARSWKCECLAWYPLEFEDDKENGVKDNVEQVEGESKEVFIFEIAPANAPNR
ncbi:Putative methyltransferase [Seminavis robusta]|uniref:Methyltransferase n=1 Tax=Seminavis robusta TaxID=568900 RepID=A0A9N8HGJ2_9STRA|nr:Putative methyltransferase [Seminavis robusta]|eukprot:Sro400_g135130.1 Putative methyltransferase (386) ;mRNA; r:40482-41639